MQNSQYNDTLKEINPEYRIIHSTKKLLITKATREDSNYQQDEELRILKHYTTCYLYNRRFRTISMVRPRGFEPPTLRFGI